MGPTREYRSPGTKPDLQNRPGTRRMRERPWIAWICAAPMPLIGVALGVYLSMAAFDRVVEAGTGPVTRMDVCGDIGSVYLLNGFVVGSIGGIIAGAAIANLVTWLVHGRAPQQDAFDEISGEHAPTNDLVANESRNQELRAEIDWSSE